MKQGKLDLEPLWQVPREEIEIAREAAKKLTWSFNYTNRGGKQYVRLLYQGDGYPYSRPDREFMNKYFPKARHTSGGYGNGFDCTYRINPEERK